MAVTHTLQANFSASLGKGIVWPSGAKVGVFWGTGGDGIETNRVPGGPALTISSGAPVHTTNSVNLGSQPQPTPTRNDVYDTGIALDSAGLAAGYTWACVARSLGSGSNYCQCIGSMTLASGQASNPDFLGLQQNTNRVILGGGQANRAIIQLTQPVNSAWHFIAQTSSGGATPTIIAYEFTEVQAGQSVSYVSPTKTVSATATTHFGCLSVETSTTLGPCEHAFSYVGVGPTSQANLAALAAAVRPWLARRQIAM